MRLLNTIVTTTLLAGCAALTTTAYQRPELAVPVHWEARISAQTVVPGDPWWHAFDDPQLDRLVDRVLANNQDLAIAVVNIKRAEQEIELVRANSLPVLGLSANASNTRTLGSSSLLTRASYTDATISYEVDLWGTLAAQTDAAKWEAQASRQDRESLVLQLVSNTINLYWQMAYLSEQLEQSSQSIAYSQQTLSIAEVKYRTGAISAMDRLVAEQSLAQQRAARMTLLDQQAQAETAMSLLLGDPPGEHFTVSADRLNQALPSVAEGVPADVLSRRPDVKAAEMRLREYLNTVDSTRTSYYPTLTLTGSAGTGSDALRNILQNPVGTVAAALTSPFVNWWTMRASVNAAQYSYDGAAMAFRKTVYQAMQEVENALATREHYNVEAQQLQRAIDSASASEKRYRYSYKAGAVPLQTLLDAQQALRNARAALSSIQYAQLVNQVALYQALGGGV